MNAKQGEVPHGAATLAKPSVFNAYYELTKPRLSLLSVITALVGYLSALPRHDWSVILNFVIGTALCAASAAALNQWWEREEDAIMPRTKSRPLPTKQVAPGAALVYGIALGVVGVLQLFLGVNDLAGWLGLSTILSYVLVYTPMKKITRWATEVGAVVGALPPLIGWAAAEGRISPLGWILFGILYFWQIPHFMAIAWMYRKDYDMAGYVMLSIIDPSGQQVARWSLINAAGLFIVSVLPLFMGLAGWIYGAAAVASGLWILRRSAAFASPIERDALARKLFYCSIIYLPIVLFSLVIDRWILG